MIKKISIKTRFGWISAFEDNGKLFKIKFGKQKKQINSKVLRSFKRELLRYISKKKTNINIPHKMKGNKIQKKIWTDLKKIKIGTTSTYGKLAKKHKVSPRYVGRICSQNNLLLIIPCHRVIKSNGALGGFTSAGGVDLKRSLLEFEKR